jgi:regulator of ribonuclease activity A
MATTNSKRQFATADLYDEHGNDLQVAEPVFRDFGGRRAFYGEVRSVQCFEDNSLVREALESNGHHKVLIVDGGGSLRCALLGDQLAALAAENDWAGVIVNGCVRDSTALANTSIGIRALACNPRKSVKLGAGERSIPVSFAAVTFSPGDYVYADEDGIVISSRALL